MTVDRVLTPLVRRRRPAAIAVLAVALVAVAAGAAARPGEAARPQASVALVRLGTFDDPTDVTSAPGDPRLFVVQKGGRVIVLVDGVRRKRPFIDLHRVVSHQGERGLLSIAFDPRFARNGLVYAAFTAHDGDLHVVELHVPASHPDHVDRTLRTVLVVRHRREANHNGGQLAFDAAGDLLIGTGDGGGEGDPRGHGQKLTTLAGKLLRIDPHRQRDGSPYGIPAGQPITRRALPEIYAYGLRNPWRFSYDAASGDILIGDVGQSSWEEIDDVSESAGLGANFGWSCYEGLHRYAPHASWPSCQALYAAGTATMPILDYAHDPGCAVIGGYIVHDPALPALDGRYLYGDYCSGDLRTVVAHPGSASDDSSLGVSVAGLSSFGEDSAGRLYAVSTDSGLYRLVPA
jgi:glucose/arabinose dehydrogenase